MPTTHDYYEILEIQPDADGLLVKSQYRKLVRLNHPDISPDKESAHARMQLILEAYTVLSDAEKRAAYDRARQKREAAKAAESGATATPTAPSRLAPRSSPGGGMRPMPPRSRNVPSSYGGRVPSRSSGPQGGEVAPAATNTRARLLTMVFDAANLYFEDGRTQEAIAICERVMKADATNAEAPALLGDIYADQGRIDLALMNYERAVRRQPHNLLYRQKWESVKGANPSNPANFQPIPQGKSRPNRTAKASGCGGQIIFWIFLVITAATPFLILYLGDQ